MADHQPPGVEANRNLLSRSQAPDAQTAISFRGKDGPQVIRRGEVHRVIQAGIRRDPTLEPPCSTIDLAQELDLQPALAGLDDIQGRLGAGSLRDTEKADLSH